MRVVPYKVFILWVAFLIFAVLTALSSSIFQVATKSAIPVKTASHQKSRSSIRASLSCDSRSLMLPPCCMEFPPPPLPYAAAVAG